MFGDDGSWYSHLMLSRGGFNSLLEDFHPGEVRGQGARGYGYTVWNPLLSLGNRHHPDCPPQHCHLPTPPNLYFPFSTLGKRKVESPCNVQKWLTHTHLSTHYIPSSRAIQSWCLE